MSKDIAFDNETRTKMAAGVNKLADAVRVTIGPKGRYVAMQKEHESPTFPTTAPRWPPMSILKIPSRTWA